MIRASSIPAERAAGKLIGSTTTVSEKPILFSAPMILAILAGTKTVTRRVVKPQPPPWATEVGVSAFTPPGMLSARGNHPEHGPSESFIKRRYAVGDRIWVRETWAKRADCEDGSEKAKHYVCYRADRPVEAGSLDDEWHRYGKWRPSIFMPRWASRIRLEITDVKVERLQAITEEQAKTEGVEQLDGALDEVKLCARAKQLGLPATEARVWFAELWDGINRDRAPWASNPFVWCVSFRRIKP